MLAKPKREGPGESPGPRFRYDLWCAWQDSNLQPLGSKPSTLSVELQAQEFGCTGMVGRATGFEPVISWATARRLDHLATLAANRPAQGRALAWLVRPSPNLNYPSKKQNP